MEDILASIRRIIADEDDTSVPRERDAVTAYAQDKATSRSLSAGSVVFPYATRDSRLAESSISADQLPEEDVLDLDLSMQPSTDAFPSASAAPALDVPAPAPVAAGRDRAANPEVGDATKTFTARRLDKAGDEPGSSASQQGSRPTGKALSGLSPVWSRRELPKAPSSGLDGPKSRSFDAAAGRPFQAPPPKSEPLASKPARLWDEDIQMPIPEQGPVSFVPEATPADASPPTMPALKAVADALARGAANALNDDELRQTQRLDFERLETINKSEIAQSFADALEANESILPSTDISPTSSSPETGAPSFGNSDVAPSTRPSALGAEMHRTVTSELEDALSGLRSDDTNVPFEDVSATSSVVSPEPVVLTKVQSRSKAATPSKAGETSPMPQAALHDMLLPSTPDVSAVGARSLEDSVRDMLRPMMMQWLNENMPRILENALREEVAARGFAQTLKPDTRK